MTEELSNAKVNNENKEIRITQEILDQVKNKNIRRGNENKLSDELKKQLAEEENKDNKSNSNTHGGMAA